jgi:hypothetical protein
LEIGPTPQGDLMTKKEKLMIFLGILAFVLFNYPLLKIFNRDLCLGEFPLLIFYVFGVWLLTIVILLIGKSWLSLKD